MRMILICVWTLLSAAVPAVAQETACSHVDREWIGSHVYLSPEARIVFQEDRGGICEVVLAIDGDLVPVYAGKDYIVSGRMFRQQRPVTRDTMAGLSDVAEQERRAAEEREALAVEKRKLFFKANSDALAALVSMTFGPAGAKQDIYVITDPNCSHCKTLLPLLEEVAFEAKLTLKVVVYPVLGRKSREMANHAICSRFTYAQYRDMTGETPLSVCDAAEARIEKTNTLLRSADIGFVPLVVAGDGAWVVEGNDVNAVKARLGLDHDPGDQGDGEGCAPVQE